MFMVSKARLLEALGVMGAACCAYNSGIDVEGWLRGRCDCKYGATNWEGGRLDMVAGEGTGCPEMRSIYNILSAMTADEYDDLVHRAGGLISGGGD